MPEPDNLKYRESHEWVRVAEEVATVGLTFYAQDKIQEIVYVELPRVGTRLSRGDTFGVIESVKAAFELYVPVSGEVIAINKELEDRPERINESPYDQGWMIQIHITEEAELDELMDAAAYRGFLRTEEEL